MQDKNDYGFVPEMSDLEKVGYYFACVATLGGYWFMKCLIKKAILETKD